MKRPFSARAVSAGVALILVAGCTDRGGDGGSPDEAAASPADGPTASATATSTPTTTGGSNSPSSGARSIAEETDDFVFDYSYPAEAGDIPALAALLDQRLERARAALARQAAQAREEARDNGFPYNKYSRGMEWKVVARLPDWLSLSGEQNSYTGGAHGNYGVQSLVWNKRTDEAMDGVALFASPQALGDALGERYCTALDQVRAERGVAPVEEGDTVFAACPSLDELTVLVGSSNGRTFNRLTLYAGPYMAGSYAEGAYEVSLDIDQAVLAAVKPEYRASFSARR